MARRPSTCETSAARLVPCDKIRSALQVATQSVYETRIRQTLSRNSSTAFNRQVHEILVVYAEVDLHGLAANLAVFNVALSTG